MTNENTLYATLRLLQEQLYDKCGLELANLTLHPEGAAYGACRFELAGQKVEHRISKITPTKTGQFVTIWKRGMKGATEPFDLSDDMDLIAITARKGDQLGQFLFPKAVLAEKGIVSQDGKYGKRGIRVYPPWDIATSRQAEKTRNWQAGYFVAIKNDDTTDIGLAKRVLTEHHKQFEL